MKFNDFNEGRMYILCHVDQAPYTSKSSLFNVVLKIGPS